MLFDGHNLDAWAKKNGKSWLEEDGPARWKLVEGGAVEVVPGSDCIITHQKFGDCKVHVEFRTLGFPSNSGDYSELDKLRNQWNASGLNAAASGMIRHAGNGLAVAADGHGLRLKMPPYNPGAPAPACLGDIGDVRSDPNGGAWPAPSPVDIWVRELKTQPGF